MSGSLYEIRDYHYDPARFDAYKHWSLEAVDVLGDRIDLVGWWLDSGDDSQIMGSEPMELPYGSANVTWMIRWDDMDHRNRVWEGLWEDPAWMACWEKHPGFGGYLHMSVRFMNRVGAHDRPTS